MHILYPPRAALSALLAAAVLLPPADGEPPAAYVELRAVELEYVGDIRDGTFERDRLHLSIDDAGLYLTQPVNGRRTGAVLLGRGRLHLEPPNVVEREQMEKYADESALDREFDRAVLRFGGDEADELAALATASGRADLREAAKQYRERHQKLLEEHFVNVDGRVLVDLMSPERNDTFFLAEIDAGDWITVNIDPRRMEEVRVYRSHGSDRTRDIWTSFHLARDYPPGGRHSTRLGRQRPEEHWQPDFEVPDIAVDMRLDDDDDIEAAATIRLRALRPTAVVRLDISPVLQVTELRWSPDDGEMPDPVIDPDDPEAVSPLAGEPLAFVQEHLGRGMREDRYDAQVIVPLPAPLAPGDTLQLHLRYRGELIYKMPSRQYIVRDPTGWYPQHPHARRSRFRTTFRTPDNHYAPSGGSIDSEGVHDGTRIVTRTVATPTIGMSFHYGRLESSEHTAPDAPTFTVFASRDSTAFNPGRRDETIVDLRAAMELFADYFGPVPFDDLLVVETPGTGAWAFHGFLLLPSSSFGGMHTGVAEFYRAHELAHQWWGNSVTWASYHDQWLSEGFAQYSAALFAHRGLDDEEQFVEMLEAWRKDVMGRGDVGQRLGTRNYGYPPETLRESDGSRSGPVWIGYRLGSDKTPPDYRILVYEKGAYVLHMLRMLAYDWDTGSETLFQQLMRTFQQRFAGGHASTEDFFDVAEEVYGQDLMWFMDQWVYGTDIPTYRPDLEAERVGGGWRLRGTIRQEDTAHDFRMPLPVRVWLDDGTSHVVVVAVAGDGAVIDEPLPGPVDRIEVNPLEAVLANVR